MFTEPSAPVAQAVQVTLGDQPWPLQVARPQPGRPEQQLPAVQLLAVLLHAVQPACNEGCEKDPGQATMIRRNTLSLLCNTAKDNTPSHNLVSI